MDETTQDDQAANRAREEAEAQRARDAVDPAVPGAGKIDTHSGAFPLPRSTLSEIVQGIHDSGKLPQMHGMELALFGLKLKELQTAARSLLGKAGDEFDQILFSLIDGL